MAGRDVPARRSRMKQWKRSVWRPPALPWPDMGPIGRIVAQFGTHRIHAEIISLYIKALPGAQTVGPEARPYQFLIQALVFADPPAVDQRSK